MTADIVFNSGLECIVDFTQSTFSATLEIKESQNFWNGNLYFDYVLPFNFIS